MTEELIAKVRHSADVLKVAVELSRTYYHRPIVICYSGGKDSDVLLDIAVNHLNKSDFVVLNSHTTLDAPDTVYYIRRKFEALRAEGIEAIVKYPMYKGQRDSFWKLCQRKKMLPTRITRFCCAKLKEVSTPHQIACVGVRAAESKNREGRGEFGLRADRNTAKTAQHVKAMIAFDQAEDNESSFECKIIKGAKKHKSMVCNPIYQWTETDVWDYIKVKGLEVNPLYARGYKRVGCVGCPMAARARYKEFADFPKYKLNMIRLCQRILDGDNAIRQDFKSGEDFFRWWLEEDWKQLRFEDLAGVERREIGGE